MNNTFDTTFKHLYPLSKTLRFELRPVNETANFIDEFKNEGLKAVVAKDEQRAEHYKKAKSIIDDYHRDFIENALRSIDEQLTYKDLSEAFDYYCKLKNASFEEKQVIIKEWQSLQKKLRKAIVECFKKQNKFVRLFKKELITEDLPDWLEQHGRREDIAIIEEFKSFTTYFKGFHENRKNIYSDEDKSTAIAFRLVHENLGKYFDNCLNYIKLIREDCEGFESVTEQLGLDKDLSEYFVPENFTNFVSQSGISEYNTVLGGMSTIGGEKIKGVNEAINLFKQQKARNPKQVSKMKPLFKQVLSDRIESRSFIPDQFENDKSVIETLAKSFEQVKPLLKLLNKALSNFEKADEKRIYIKKSNLNNISQGAWGNYQLISDAIEYHKSTLKTKKSVKVFEDKAVFSSQELIDILEEYNKHLDKEQQFTTSELFSPLLNQTARDNCFSRSPRDSYEALGPLLTLEEFSMKRKAPRIEGEKGEEGFEQIQLIKAYLDTLKEALDFVKPLMLIHERKAIEGLNKDDGFYVDFEYAFLELESYVIPLFNKTRNYFSRSQRTTEKFKVSFDNPALLKSWNTKQEKNNSAILLRKNEMYYLGLLASKTKKEFKNFVLPTSTNVYEKFNFIEAGKTGQNIQNLMVIDGVTVKKNGRKNAKGVNVALEELKNRYLPTEINNIRKSKSYSKQSDNFDRKDLAVFIEYYQQRTHEYYSTLSFTFKDPANYESFDEFTDDANAQGSQIKIKEISGEYIDELVSTGQLYLFQIYNKDFSMHAKGKPNLHTLYWKGLFEPSNLKDVVLKLNGEAEIFFRPHTIKPKDIIKHKANCPIDNKNPYNTKRNSQFEYDIVKDRRFTVDKFFFHVPITLNFISKELKSFNVFTNSFLKDNDKVNIIGIDRGERHLLYLTIIDQNGHIIKQESLNEIISDNFHKNDYQQKLDQKEKERDIARKSWSTIENIKELKEGYLSHVVHRIAQLVVEYNAIVCLEDLNFGFKRGRIKVEKQVYQKFEKALIDKLNYLVFKNTASGKTGHYLSAYQLTDKFKSFKDLGKQSGILFYVNADYTSKIDPTTGFVNLLNLTYKSKEDSKMYLSNFECIRYDEENDFFSFSFDYANVGRTQKLGRKTRWTIHTVGEKRYQNSRKVGQWKTESINVTERLKSLFSSAKISLQSENLIDEILMQDSKQFFKDLYWLLRLTCSLRYSRVNSQDDFILSPVMNTEGKFFDSRNASDDEPKNSDANGAYHIALKGLWSLHQISNSNDLTKLKLYMSNHDWFDFVQLRDWQE